MHRLNLGCGDDYRKDWVNVDIRASVGPDIVVDVDHHPLPFRDDTFDEILLDNVLEHLDDQLAALHEIHRIARPGATVTFRGPHWNSHGAWADPTHTRPFTQETFSHYLVEGLFGVEEISCTRIRFGKLLPERTALFLADHIGHIVSEIEVVTTVKD